MRQLSILLISITLVLSAFTHLWNPIGFPSIYTDEDVYLSRTVLLLNGAGIEYDHFYDHPFFGWLLLGGILEIVGYPNTIHSNLDTTVESIEKIYSAPRIVMGFLVILDTFLVYLIVIYRYNNKTIAFFASLFFAVMPMTWITRFILLDPNPNPTSFIVYIVCII